MENVERLEALGRAIMSASVEAEYLEQRRVVDSLDAAFAEIVRVLAGRWVQGVQVEFREGVEAVERALDGG